MHSEPVTWMYEGLWSQRENVVDVDDDDDEDDDVDGRGQ